MIFRAHVLYYDESYKYSTENVHVVRPFSAGRCLIGVTATFRPRVRLDKVT